MKKFKLSEIQAKAILDMRLQRLTGLERKKIEDEYRETIKLIERLKAILKSKQLQLEIIRKELLRSEGEVRRRAAHGDRLQGRGIQHRGHDRRRAGGHHRQPRRVHQAVPGERLPAPDRGADGEARARRRRKTISSSMLFVGRDARLHDALHRPRAGATG